MSALPPPPPPPPPGTEPPTPPVPRAPTPPVRATGSRGTAFVVGVALVLVLVAGLIGGIIVLTGRTTSSPASSPAATPTGAATAAASAGPQPSGSAAATPLGNAAADFATLASALYPTTEGGQRNTCFQGDTTFAQCPVTDRLRSALQAAVAKQSGADPICGCQNVDNGLSYTYSQNGASGGTLKVSMFSGSGKVTYIAVAAPGGGFLVDDIDYCSASPPASIYGGAATGC